MRVVMLISYKTPSTALKCWFPGSTINSTKLLHKKNADSPIVARLTGKVMLVKLVQY